MMEAARRRSYRLSTWAMLLFGASLVLSRTTGAAAMEARCAVGDGQCSGGPSGEEGEESKAPGLARWNRVAIGPRPVDPGEDAAVEEWLLHGKIEAITIQKKHLPGRSIFFHVFLEGGHRALFKPSQRNRLQDFKAEIASYHVDRLFRAHRVPVVRERQLALAALLEAVEAFGAGDDHHITRAKVLEGVIVDADGVSVRGAMVQYLSRADTTSGAMQWWGPRTIYPSGNDNWWSNLNRNLDVRYEPAVFQKMDKYYLAEWSDVVVLDLLNSNQDRFGAGNNVVMSKGGPVVCIDNTYAHLVRGRGVYPPGLGARWHKEDRPDTDLACYFQGLLCMREGKRVCRFRRYTIDNVRSVVERGSVAEALERSLRRLEQSRILAQAQLDGVAERTQLLLDQVDACVEQYGEEEVFF